MNKRIRSLLLSMTLLVGLFIPVSAVSGNECIASSSFDNWKLTADGTLTFSDCYSIYSYADPTKDPLYPYRDQIKRIIIEGNVDAISTEKFSNYSQLEAVEVTGSITSIGDYAFENCVNLNFLDLGRNVRNIGIGAFSGCSSLESVYIHCFSTFDTIEDHAFSGCHKLREISIPGDITLGAHLFLGCPELTTVYISESSSLYGFKAADNSFYGVTANVLYPPYSYPAQYLMKDYGGKLTWAESNEGICGANAKWHYDAEQKHLTITGAGRIGSYFSGNETPWGAFHDEILSIQVEEGITHIPSYSFEYCKNATEIILPKTLLSINLNAFNDCEALNNLLLPSSILTIGDGNRDSYPTYSFIRCPSLTDVYYLGTQEEWARITDSDLVQNLSVEMTLHFMTEYFKEPTCTQSGMAPYYTFEEGSAYPGIYNEEKQPISQPVVIPAIGHSYENGLCILCGEKEPGVTINGTVNILAEVTLELWDEAGEAALYTTTAQDGVYALEDVNPGSYILKITSPGYVTRRYSLAVAPGSKAPELLLCRPGDVTEDGKTNIMDVSRIYAHIRGTGSLEGYRLSCADLNSDGRCSILDAAKAYTHVKGTTPLY